MKKFFIIIILSLIRLAVFADDSSRVKRVHLNGYLKLMEQLSFVDSPDTSTLSTLIHNRVNFKWTPHQNWMLRLEARNRIFYGEQLKMNRAFMKTIGEDQGAVELSKVWLDKYSVGIHSIVDRALVNYSSGKWDVTLGRQRINWGVNLVWNPNDIFNTYNFFDFDYEERPGSDAVRIQYHMGGFAGLEAAFRKGRNDDDITGALLYRNNMKGYDYQVLGGVYQKDLVAGAGWAGNIYEAGFKGEVTYFHPYESISDTNGLLNASLSFDYSFRNGLYVHLSGLYNSNGTEKLNFFSTQQFFLINPKQLLPFKYTGFIQVSKQINPLMNAGMSQMYSPVGNTWVIIPNFQYSIAANWDVSLIGQLFFADVNKVYRSLGNSIFLRFKMSF